MPYHQSFISSIISLAYIQNRKHDLHYSTARHVPRHFINLFRHDAFSYFVMLAFKIPTVLTNFVDSDIMDTEENFTGKATLK